MPTCDHCLLEFPQKDEVRDEIDGKEHIFCCGGCRGIFRLIHSEGLDSFYEKRVWKEAGSASADIGGEIDIKPFAELVRDSEGANEIDVYIEGIRCASCVWLNEKILSRTEGVEYARVNYATHKARIKWDPGKTGLESIIRRIRSIGYRPKPYSESERFRAAKAETKDLLVRFGTAGFLASQLMIYTVALYAGYFQGMESGTKLIFEIISLLLTIPVIFYAGSPFIKSTISGLRHMRFNMDSLITIGAGSAFVYSIYEIYAGGEVYFDTASMIITLILLGRLIESSAKGKASETIERLASLAPKEARLVRVAEDGAETRCMTPVEAIRAGDLIEVVPGERIPLDGVVRKGESEADESIITGESRPVAKKPGSSVIGGSVNMFGSFVFEVTKTGKDTVLAGIIRAVEDAQAAKPRIQTAADRIVGWFVPAIIMAAFATVLWYLYSGASSHKALMAGISVVVIACPCSLGLATPLAVLMFTSRASARGILIKGGEVIENTGRITDIIFDKTGTITRGRPVLTKIIPIDSETDEDRVLSVSASLEAMSEHSIGKAIVEAWKKSPLPSYQVSDFMATPGRGIEGMVDGKRTIIGNRAMAAENGMDYFDEAAALSAASEFEKRGDTVICVGWEGKVRGLMVVSDVVRGESEAVVRELRTLGCGVSVVSGDNSDTTRSIGSGLGIPDAVGEASPSDKKEIMAGMQKQGKKVMMIGDGINDAPALTQASVGVAMGRGTDIALESADAVLVRDDLTLIPFLIRLSRKTDGIIKQNIFWAFFYNVVAIPLAVAGLLHPIIAAAAMAASSLFVVGNSLRIKNI